MLEAALKKTDKPVTCVDLMDDPTIRATALAEYGEDVRVTTNKVSDALGLMWRRNLLTRYPAPRENSTFTRYAYIWDKSKDTITPAPVPSPTPSSVHANIIEQQAAKSLLGHNEMSTTESYIKQRKIDQVQPNRKRSK